jgi:hypothetical protein
MAATRKNQRTGGNLMKNLAPQSKSPKPECFSVAGSKVHGNRYAILHPRMIARENRRRVLVIRIKEKTLTADGETRLYGINRMSEEPIVAVLKPDGTGRYWYQ